MGKIIEILYWLPKKVVVYRRPDSLTRSLAIFECLGTHRGREIRAPE